MKNIRNLEPKQATIFESSEGKIILVTNKTEVKVTTDGTDFKKEYSGFITFIDESGFEIEDSGDFIKWDYVEEIDIIS